MCGRDWSSDVCSSDLKSIACNWFAVAGGLPVLTHLSSAWIAALNTKFIGPALIGLSHVIKPNTDLRSEERRVGKEGRYRGSSGHGIIQHIQIDNAKAL